METKIVSDTIQQFKGENYWLCGFYFQRYGKRLHRAVWEFCNSRTVPDGYHIHHKDGNRHNNQIENLELIEKLSHLKRHGKTMDKEIAKKNLLKYAQPAAVKWHKSEDGREFHKRIAKLAWKDKQPRKLICLVCSIEYETLTNGESKFCSKNCNARYFRCRRSGRSFQALQDQYRV